MKQYCIVLLGALLLAGCGPVAVSTPPPTTLPSTAEEAQHALFDFLTRLQSGNYESAVPLYGGDYEALQVFNPEIDANHRTALWAWACDTGLLQCLKPRSLLFQGLEGDTYVFQVEFSNPDGSLFVLGPCCGASETEMPPVSRFEFRVRQEPQGGFVVLNTPPYVP